MEKYALLFSGKTERRHVYDLERLYRSLTNIHKFKCENIFILLSDCTISYEYDQQDMPLKYLDDTEYTMQVSDAGNLEGFDRTIAKLKKLLESEDLLFVHTNGHGGETDSSKGYPVQSTLWTASNSDSIPADYFWKQLQSLPHIKTLLIMMAQCHSGGFLEPIKDYGKALNIAFSCATTKEGLSIGGTEGNPFATNWIEKITKSPFVSCYEAHRYAADKTHKQDRPLFIDSPEGCGKEVGLR